MKLKEIAIKGRKFDVYVNEDGKFYVNVDGSNAYFDSIVELETKLSRNIKNKPKCNVRIVAMSGKCGAITGVHGANGNYLIKWDNGETEQLSGWSFSRITQMDDESSCEYAELVKSANDSAAKRDAFYKEHVVDVQKLVEAELNSVSA